MKSRQQPAGRSSAVREENEEDSVTRVLFTRGLVLTALGMALGLTLEGLIGYKTPAYLQDSLRRELFRLAHAHLTLLGLLASVCGLGLSRWQVSAPAAVRRALLAGALLMPLGFFLGGMSHPEGDPGPGIWLAPAGALLVLYGLCGVVMALRAGAKAP